MFAGSACEEGPSSIIHSPILASRVLAWWKDDGTLWGLLYRGTNRIPEGSTLTT